ncbi:MAG TPA: mersacidin/lichenicidin family type 2 lantibiotic [Candidatus Angelobacter sp.]|nr:mersacidin/lichenicidin family type 2 lantibiotic [Candidatus Angelobacter sp.]
MTNAEVIRAWKDPDFRAGLSTTEMSLLPDNPAGKLDLSDSQLRDTYLLTRFVCGTTVVDSCVKPPAQCP